MFIYLRTKEYFPISSNSKRKNMFVATCLILTLLWHVYSQFCIYIFCSQKNKIRDIITMCVFLCTSFIVSSINAFLLLFLPFVSLKSTYQLNFLLSKSNGYQMCFLFSLIPTRNEEKKKNNIIEKSIFDVRDYFQKFLQTDRNTKFLLK